MMKNVMRHLNILPIINMSSDGYFDSEDIHVSNKFCFNIDFIFFIFPLSHMDKKHKHAI